MNKYRSQIKIFIKTFLKDPLFLKRWEWDGYYGHRDENRLTIRALGRRRGRPYPYKGDSFMFVEDAYLGVTPLMSDHSKYPVRIEPASPTIERLISEGISERGYNRFLFDSLFEFIRATTHTLFQEGVVFYEIVYKKNATGEIEKFGLEFVEPAYLFRFLGNYYQFVPWWEAKDAHIRVQIIKVPKDNILRIDFPKQFGGKRAIGKILKRLYYLSKEPMPKFYMDAMGKNENIGFDFKEFVRNKYLEIAQLTKDLGWNQRQLSGDNVTEYYSIERYLREKKMQVIIREKIMSKLNEILNRPPLNLGVRVIAENLPTLITIEEQERALQAGNVTFADILNTTKF